jgi:anti-sigma regulatory factor (Ser/Thr protein kinase)
MTRAGDGGGDGDGGGGYLHHALFYDSPQALVAAAGPFLRAGLASGDLPVLVCGEQNNALLAEALGGEAEVAVLEPASIYTRVLEAVDRYQRLALALQRRGAHRVRLVGEVDFGPPQMWDEWTRFEAIVNLALAPYPLSSVCAYDTRTLPTPILTAARSTHPNLLTSAGREPNPGYRHPVTVLRALPPEPPDPLEATPPRFTADLTAPADLTRVRRDLRTALTTAGVPTSLIDDVVVATHEICTNGLIHGRPPVLVRAWTRPDRIHCTITDHGNGHDHVLAGYLPPPPPVGTGAGLWVTRNLVDRISGTPTTDGFVVRLTTQARNTQQPANP